MLIPTPKKKKDITSIQHWQIQELKFLENPNMVNLNIYAKIK